MELLLGLITGIIFGFLLQKSQVLRFEKQVGFLLLKDMTIIKFMFSAILVGMVGVHFLNDLGTIDLKIKGTVVGAQVIGGLLFGIGWAIAGYCPSPASGWITSPASCHLTFASKAATARWLTSPMPPATAAAWCSSTRTGPSPATPSIARSDQAQGFPRKSLSAKARLRRLFSDKRACLGLKSNCPKRLG